jgi:hypothetical protein
VVLVPAGIAPLEHQCTLHEEPGDENDNILKSLKISLIDQEMLITFERLIL